MYYLFDVVSQYVTLPVSTMQPTQERPNTRRERVISLHKSGMSYAEIGRRLGITRERARQLTKVKTAPDKPALESKAILTASEAAQLIGVHVNTVRRWNKKGALKGYRIGTRGDRRFRREEIDSFVKEAESWEPA